MAALNRSLPGLLRCIVPLRSVFVWIVAALVLAGAASYSHGSRYAMIPDHALAQSPDEPAAGTLLQEDNTPGPADMPAAAPPSAGAAHHAGPAVGPAEPERDCCKRRHAPRVCQRR